MLNRVYIGDGKFNSLLITFHKRIREQQIPHRRQNIILMLVEMFLHFFERYRSLSLRRKLVKPYLIVNHDSNLEFTSLIWFAL